MANGAADYLAELRDWDADAFDEHWELAGRLVSDVGTKQALAAARQWCDSADAATHSVGSTCWARWRAETPTWSTSCSSGRAPHTTATTRTFGGRPPLACSRSRMSVQEYDPIPSTLDRAIAACGPQ